MSDPPVLHAGLIALRQDGLWRGALVRGPSGAGKSDLALRAISEGFRLAADDRTIVFASGGRLWGAAPRPLGGLIEARGLGIVPAPWLPLAEIVLGVQCAARRQDVERMAPRSNETILGVAIPILTLWPFDASAPAKVRQALSHLGAHRQQGYQAALLPEAMPGQGGS